MKKYRLKQWYPDTPSYMMAGFIVDYYDEEEKAIYTYPDGMRLGFNLPPHHLECRNFWELIKEEKPLFVTEDGKELFTTNDLVLVVNSQFKISMWSVGEYMKAEKSGNLKVFYQVDNADKYIEENKPKTLFVTEDGVEVYNDTTEIISVSVKHHTVSNWQYRYLSKPLDCENFKHFGVEKNALKYIEENKPNPLFVTGDGVEVFDENEKLTVVFSDFEKGKCLMERILRADNVSKLKVFKHEAFADEYIWRNKPVFSYNDFESYGYDLFYFEQLAKERSKE